MAKKQAPRLLVNGKPIERPRPKRIQKILDLCDSLPYRTAIYTQDLVKRLGGKPGNNVLHSGANEDDKAEVRRRCFKIEYHCVVWASPKTIQALKDGRIVP